MHALTTAAVQNLSLLRRLQQGGVETKATLAAEMNRDPSNLNRALKSLEADGLISGLDLTETGERVLLAADVADGKANPVREGQAPRAWTHADLTPNPDQPRKEFDAEQLDQLAATIAADGQLQNILARPNPDKDGPALQIVGGERRYRAMGLLIERGLWSADHPVKVEVRDLTDAQVDALALIENMQRADLSFLEEATAFHRLHKSHGWSTAEIAEKVNKTPRFVQYRLKLLELTDRERQQLEDGEITYKQALAIIERRPKPLDLTPTQLLILAEVLAAANKDRTAYSWNTAECDPVVAGLDISNHGLEAHLQITGPNFEGAYKVGFKGDMFERLSAQHSDLISADRDAALRSIRARAAGAEQAEDADDSGTHVTTWLNGPFALTPEGQAAKEEHEAKARAREAREAEELASLRARDALLKQATAKTETILAANANLQPTPRTLAPVEDLEAVFQAAESPLPWRIELKPHGASLVDRNGKAVEFQWGGEALSIRLKMIMTAVNVAAGFAPEVVAEAQEPAPVAEQDTPEEDAA